MKIFSDFFLALVKRLKNENIFHFVQFIVFDIKIKLKELKNDEYHSKVKTSSFKTLFLDSTIFDEVA